MEQKVLLTYGERRKIVELASLNVEVKAAIIENARRVFDLKDHKIYPQEYIEDFEEWIDIEEDFVAKPKQKIKIVSVAPVRFLA